VRTSLLPGSVAAVIDAVVGELGWAIGALSVAVWALGRKRAVPAPA